MNRLRFEIQELPPDVNFDSFGFAEIGNATYEVDSEMVGYSSLKTNFVQDMRPVKQQR